MVEKVMEVNTVRSRCVQCYRSRCHARGGCVYAVINVSDLLTAVAFKVNFAR
jgi:hypothetical protein